MKRQHETSFRMKQIFLITQIISALNLTNLNLTAGRVPYTPRFHSNVQLFITQESCSDRSPSPFAFLFTALMQAERSPPISEHLYLVNLGVSPLPIPFGTQRPQVLALVMLNNLDPPFHSRVLFSILFNLPPRCNPILSYRVKWYTARIPSKKVISSSRTAPLCGLRCPAMRSVAPGPRPQFRPHTPSPRPLQALPP